MPALARIEVRQHHQQLVRTGMQMRRHTQDLVA